MTPSTMGLARRLRRNERYKHLVANALVKLHEAYPYLREKSLHHWKRTQQTLDAHHTRAQMLEYRKRILDKKQKMNYPNEYDRLRNALQETVLRRSVAGGIVRGPKIRGKTRRTC